jgi:hypothetical protein
LSWFQPAPPYLGVQQQRDGLDGLPHAHLVGQYPALHIGPQVEKESKF